MVTETAPDITHHDAAAARALYGPLAAVYAEVYAAKTSDPFFTVDRFAERFQAHSSRPGYSLVTAHLDGVLAGYAYGVPLVADSCWWKGLVEPLPAELVRETGRRTFALNEIMVRASYRGRGIARRLHDSLLLPRPEARATLLVEGENATARAAYEHWGWTRIGRIRPFADAPVYDSMLLELSAWRARVE